MNDFSDLVNVFIGLIDQLIPFLFAVTFIVIIWGIIKAWIINGGETDAVTEGKQLALHGVIALVVMSGLWGILQILQNSLF